MPTVAETLPGYAMAVWYGVLGPRGMPPAVVARLNAEINRALLLPEVKGKMAAIGVRSRRNRRPHFATRMRADAEKWGRAIRELGVTAGDA